MDRAEMAKKLIESLKPRQLAGEAFPCPRCGRNTMRTDRPALNALSRYADVYICDECGTEEALLDMTSSQLPLTEWGMALGFMGRG